MIIAWLIRYKLDDDFHSYEMEEKQISLELTFEPFRPVSVWENVGWLYPILVRAARKSVIDAMFAYTTRNSTFILAMRAAINSYHIALHSLLR